MDIYNPPCCALSTSRVSDFCLVFVAATRHVIPERRERQDCLFIGLLNVQRYSLPQEPWVGAAIFKLTS